MKFNYLSLASHLKNAPGDLYCLTGKELCLIDEATQRLITAFQLQAHNKALNLEKSNFWIEASQDWSQIFSQLQHYSLFPCCNLLHIRYDKSSLDANIIKNLNTYLAEIPANTYIILQAPNLNQPSFLNTLTQSSNKHHIECPCFNDSAYRQYIQHKFIQSNLTVSQNIPALLAQLTQGNLAQAIQCITQLSLLHNPGEIVDENTLEKLLGDESLFPIYQWCNTCVTGDINIMLKQMKRLQQLNTEPILMLWWITKVVRQLLTLKQKSSNHLIPEDIWKALGIWSNQKTYYLNAINRHTEENLFNMLQNCQALDYKLKNFQTYGAWSTLEAIAIQICNPNLKL